MFNVYRYDRLVENRNARFGWLLPLLLLQGAAAGTGENKTSCVGASCYVVQLVVVCVYVVSRLSGWCVLCHVFVCRVYVRFLCRDSLYRVINMPVTRYNTCSITDP